MASGYIAGGAIAGIGIAFLAGGGREAKTWQALLRGLWRTGGSECIGFGHDEFALWSQRGSLEQPHLLVFRAEVSRGICIRRRGGGQQPHALIGDRHDFSAIHAPAPGRDVKLSQQPVPEDTRWRRERIRVGIRDRPEGGIVQRRRSRHEQRRRQGVSPYWGLVILRSAAARSLS